MPEGPELCMNSRFVNRVCGGRLFAGKIVKSAVSKCADVDFSSEAYVICSESRGKEMALTLQCSLDPVNKLRLLFRFGMSGKFRFTPLEQVPKHAHLQFFSSPTDSDASEQQKFVLSFVDVRRFGSWHVMPEGWGENRGPDPMFEYRAFRTNVLERLEDSAFNRPICEALLNQKYFNGIGNYLRAEILYRAGVPPFTCARKVLEPLCGDEHEQDILSLCHGVPQEVVNLKQMLGKSETAVVTEDDYREFCQWLKCYENPAMNTAKDHNKRTIWFKGEAGSMCPKCKPTPLIHNLAYFLAHLRAAKQLKRQRKRRQSGPGGEVYRPETIKRETEEHEAGAEGTVEVEPGTTDSTTKAVDVKKEGTNGTAVGVSRTRKQRSTKGKKQAEGEPAAKRAEIITPESKRPHQARSRRKKPTALPTRRSSRLKMVQPVKYT